MTSGLLLLVISVLLLSLANGDGRAELKFLRFQNPNGRNRQGIHCDLVINRECDYLFEVCISTDHVAAESGETGCNVLYKKSGRIDNMNNWSSEQFQQTFGHLTYQVPHTSVANDLKVRVTVFDEDTWRHDEIVDVYQFVIRGVSSDNQWIVFKESRGDRAIALQIRVICNANYFGDQCTQLCVPDGQNHSRCDINGTKVCLEGRTGPNCSIIQQVTETTSTFRNSKELRTKEATAKDTSGTTQSSEAENTSISTFQERWLVSQNKANEDGELTTFISPILAVVASLVLLLLACLFAYRFHHYRVKRLTAERQRVTFGTSQRDEQEAVYNTSILGKMISLSAVLEHQRGCDQGTPAESITVGSLPYGQFHAK